MKNRETVTFQQTYSLFYWTCKYSFQVPQSTIHRLPFGPVHMQKILLFKRIYIYDDVHIIIQLSWYQGAPIWHCSKIIKLSRHRRYDWWSKQTNSKKAVSQQILFEQAREIRTRKGTHIHISPPTKTPPKPKKGGSNSCKSKAETQTTHTQYIRNNGQNCFFPLLALGARHWVSTEHNLMYKNIQIIIKTRRQHWTNKK